MRILKLQEAKKPASCLLVKAPGSLDAQAPALNH